MKKSEAYINESKLDYLMNLLNQINIQLPFLTNLSPEERKKNYRKGENQFSYIRKTINYAKQHPYNNPSFIEISTVATQLETAERMMELTKKAKELYERLNDTTHEVYQELYDTTRVLYMNYNMMAKMNKKGLEEIVEDLKQHFPRTGKLKSNK